MMQSQNMDWRTLITDMDVDNTSFAVDELDTLGYDAVTLAISFGNVPADVTAITLTESDTAGSGHGNVTAGVVGTTADMDGTTSVLPTAAAGDGDLILQQIDLRGRKRYLDLTITAGNGSGTATQCSVVAVLSRAGKGFDSASDYAAETVMRF